MQALSALLALLLAAAAFGAEDASTLRGKVMCGYQGWFNAPGDGMDRGFYHYRKQGKFEPDFCSVEYWPDDASPDAGEKYPTPFRRKDGSVACVPSSANPKTVLRHFREMEQFGISGVFAQRFVGEVANPSGLKQFDRVLDNIRAAARETGRVYAVMYDLSGCEKFDVLERDLNHLIGSGRIAADPAYLKHNGKPLVAIWGLFGDRPGSIALMEKAVPLLKQKGFAIMVGCNNDWRTGGDDDNRRVRAILEKCDVVSPWAVGRYDNNGLEKFLNAHVKPDLAWCKERRIDYLPVVFPGFSWYNLHGGKFDQIPRLKGQFFWNQVAGNLNRGAEMLYVAMFDEIDEGTAICRVSADPPEGGKCRFLTYDVPGDHYLFLAGEAGKALRGPRPVPAQMPKR